MTATMSGTALLLVHQSESDTGRIGVMLANRGFEIERCCPCAGDILPQDAAAYDVVVSYGGPMSANDCGIDGIRNELNFIPTVLAAGIPFIGLCLGGQLLARALGARVSPHPRGLVEAGFMRIRPTAAGRDWFVESDMFYQWHREGFEVPDSATLLATGDVYPNQAFIYGDNAVATQFHPEVTRDMIDRWTMHGVHQLGQGAAQPCRAHIVGWTLYQARVGRWAAAMLDRLGL